MGRLLALPMHGKHFCAVNAVVFAFAAGRGVTGWLVVLQMLPSPGVVARHAMLSFRLELGPCNELIWMEGGLQLEAGKKRRAQNVVITAAELVNSSLESASPQRSLA